MKTALYLITVLFALGVFGCAGGGSTSTTSQSSPTPPPTFTGNWLISLKNPNSPAAVGAYLTQDGTNVSGAISFPYDTICGTSSYGSGSGTLQNNALNLTFLNDAAPFQFFIQQGSVVFTTTEVFSGNYQLSTRCETTSGVVGGQQVPSFAGMWAGTLQSNGVQIQIAVTMDEGPVNSLGFPTVSGPVTMTGTPCFTTGTLTGDQEGINLDGTVNTADGSIVAFIGPLGTLSADQLTVRVLVDGGLCSGDVVSGTLSRQ